MLMQALQDDKVVPDIVSLDQMYGVLESYETCSFSPEEYTKAVTAALKWLQTLGGQHSDLAISCLYQRLGCYLFKKRELHRLPTAIAYSTRSSDMDGMADLLRFASRVRVVILNVQFNEAAHCKMHREGS